MVDFPVEMSSLRDRKEVLSIGGMPKGRRKEKWKMKRRKWKKDPHWLKRGRWNLGRRTRFSGPFIFILRVH